MERDPETFIRGCLFALCSIRQPLLRVPEQLAEIDAKGGDATALFGHKHWGYDYLMSHGTRTWERVCAAYPDPEEGMLELLRVPMLGIAKAAFVLQFMGHDIGCLDSRNIARLGLDARTWRTDGRKPEQLARKVRGYCALTYGLAETLWDNWCRDFARERELDAEEVSALHLTVIR